MAQRGKYGAEKRQKELKKKKKQAEKLERKRLKKLGVSPGEPVKNLFSVLARGLDAFHPGRGRFPCLG